MGTETKRPQAFHAGIESLERRETPSGAAAGVHPVVNLRGSGTLVLVSATPTPGGLVAQGAVTGRATGLGNFTGTVSGTYSGAGMLHLDGTGQLTAADGSVIEANLSGAFRALRGHSHVSSGSFRFIVTGGTNEFAHATGSGTISGPADFSTYTLRFHLSGKIRE